MLRLADVRVLNCIFAEIIREESSGKSILIGVFAGRDIGVRSYPSLQPIALYIEMLVPEVGSHEVFLRFSGPSEESGIISAIIDIVDPTDTVVFQPTPYVLRFLHAGRFTIEMSFDQEEWALLLERQLLVADDGSGVTGPQVGSRSED